QPKDPCYGGANALCKGTPAVSSDQATEFVTYLVGVLAGGGFDDLVKFTWRSNYSGNFGDGTGGVLKDLTVDSGGGVGGATLLSVTYLLTGETIDFSTPLPAALPLFACGLGVIGLLACRKKRAVS